MTFTSLCIHGLFSVEIDSRVWTTMLKRLDLQMPVLASSCQQLLSTVLTNMDSKSQACTLAFRSLLTVQAEGVVPLLVLEVCQVLGDQQVLGVTEQEMEVLRTSEGELWHAGMRKE